MRVHECVLLVWCVCVCGCARIQMPLTLIVRCVSVCSSVWAWVWVNMCGCERGCADVSAGVRVCAREKVPKRVLFFLEGWTGLCNRNRASVIAKESLQYDTSPILPAKKKSCTQRDRDEEMSMSTHHMKRAFLFVYTNLLYVYKHTYIYYYCFCVCLYIYDIADRALILLQRFYSHYRGCCHVTEPCSSFFTKTKKQ